MTPPSSSPPFRRWPWLTRQVLALSLVSLFTDMGTEMGMPLLPALTTALGGGGIVLGLIDGLADFTAALLQVYAGRRADRTGKRRPLVLAGYSLSGLVRPLFGLASAPWHLVAVRAADRVGKGLRKPATNGLLDAEAVAETRGRVFGFHDALDNAGQLLGPLLAVALLAAYAGLELKARLGHVLLWAVVPGALAAGVVLLWVRESAAARVAAPRLTLLPPSEILPVLGPIALFSLGNASDLFLLLKAWDSHAPLWSLPLLWAALAQVKVVSALAGGPLSDRLGPRAAISLGWLYYAVIYALFARVDTLAGMTALFLAYGLFHGLSEGPQKALVGSLAPPALKSTCFGWLGLTTGLVALPAGLLFGGLWEAFGPAAAFDAGAGLALAGVLWLWAGRPARPRA